jgi:ABC-type branched-subunit amino acid transport system ATPase component
MLVFDMKLTFQEPHLSILGLPDTETPSLVLLTGINGTGKTHLLRAIENGKVRVDVAPIHQGGIRFFDWNTLVPNDISATSESTRTLRRQLLDALAMVRTNHEPALASAFAHLGIHSGNIWELAQQRLRTVESTKDHDGSVGPEYGPLSKVAEVVRAASVAFSPFMHNTPHFGAFLNDLTKDMPAIFISEKDLDRAPFAWTVGDPFKQEFSEMFLRYYRLELANQLRQLAASRDKPVDESPLTDEQFRARHGDPPWDFVNATFRNANLDFAVTYPTDYYSWDNFTPRLYKKSSGSFVAFSSLSSGERTLMAFALALYYSRDNRQLVEPPKLLLLDEVDAPLHPSMCRGLLKTIDESLVQKGVNVIMARHSPSTIAVAPAESVYVMRPGKPGIHKVTKEQAIAELTAEIPTLSIGFSGRRQVFVESDTDAELYAKIYQAMRLSLASERSLDFIGVGRRPENGGPDENAGCDQVKKFVNALSNAGNESVFGLVDWDTKNTPNGRVHVLAHGERYSIENCILDPLLIAATLLHLRPGNGTLIGESSTRFRDFCEFPTSCLQDAVDKLQRRILAVPVGETPEETVETWYTGEFKLNVSKRYMHMRGHDLAALIAKALPCLGRLGDERRLRAHVVDAVIPENIRFVPKVLEDSLKALLDASVVP